MNLYCWDRSDLAGEVTDRSKIKTYLRRINLIASEIDRVVYYYILNEHGDVTQLWSQGGACKASYEYDAFGVERSPNREAENPFLYCGEYFDLSCGTYYLRARNYRPATGRFLTEDTHWNSGNMIYGNNPVKINEHSVPNIIAIMASSNLYTYCFNNHQT